MKRLLQELNLAQYRLGFIGIFTGLAILCIFLLIMFGYGDFATGIAPKNPVVIEIRAGDSLTGLIKRMTSRQLLPHPKMLRALAVLRGDASRIKAGEFLLNKAVSPNQLLDLLVTGTQRRIALTIPEGYSLKNIAAKVDRLNLADEKRFLELCNDREFIAKLNLPVQVDAPTLEGFIFPDTYYVQRGVGASRLIKMMIGVFNNKTREMLAAPALQNGLDAYQALILASIIEKETGSAEERALIAGVFHNRLKARMRLGSDPTVIYGLKNFDGNLTRRHLRTVTPYNTYTNVGLPPTPIANPGLESIRAAIQPAQVDFLYFVSKGDGTHQFSNNLKAHNRAVWKYQKQPNRNHKSSRGRS